MKGTVGVISQGSGAVLEAGVGRLTKGAAGTGVERDRVALGPS